MVAFAERGRSRGWWLGLAVAAGLIATRFVAPAPERAPPIQLVTYRCPVHPAPHLTQRVALPQIDTATAELDAQFAHAWRTANDSSAPATDRYEALVLARKLDVVLGKQQSAAINAMLRRVIPNAARAYGRQHDREHLDRVRLEAELLGVSP
jgi:hypothetical protein